ncbi:hypothetical protein [uncultured Roseobacter sp.]|nr:hypothetical protein [uncultured Roseobacter sp.]
MFLLMPEDVAEGRAYARVPGGLDPKRCHARAAGRGGVAMLWRSKRP